MRRNHDPNTEDPLERLLFDLQNLCDTLPKVIEKHPNLAPSLERALDAYHSLLHGDHKRDIGYDVEAVFAILSAISTDYRNALFGLIFASRDEAKSDRTTKLDEARVRSLLADLVETPIDGNVDLDRLRDVKAEARSLLTGEPSPFADRNEH